MPPNMVDTAADEKAWKRAKARAAKQGHAEDWPYVVGIFQKMTGKVAKGPLGPMVDGLRKAITAMTPDYQRPSGMDAMVIIQGLRVHMEQMPGDVRHGKFLLMGYGEAPGTMAADGEPFDIYVGPNKSAELVYVIDQLDENGEVDEHKAMAGFDTAEDAARAYCGQMGENKMGGMVAMHAMDLAKFLANTDRVSADPFADLAAEAGVPVIKVWMPMTGVGPLASPAVMQANGAV